MQASVLNRLVDEFAPATGGVPHQGDYSIGDMDAEITRFFVAWNPAQLEQIIRRSQDGEGAYVAYLGRFNEKLRCLLSVALKDLGNYVIRFVGPTWRYHAWGVASKMAKDIGLVRPRPVVVAGWESDLKLVTFVASKDLPRVRESLFSAGAGKYGLYSKCSFSTPGTGTFMGEKGSKPTYGQAGRLEEIEEQRLEIIVPFERIGRAISALRKVHPYEEPVIETYEVPSRREFGEGRIGSLASPLDLSEVSKRLTAVLGSKPVYASGESKVRLVVIWDGDPERGLYEALLRDADMCVGPDSQGLAKLCGQGLRTAVVEFPHYCFLMAGAKELIYMAREKSKSQAWGLRTFLPSKV